MTKGEIHTKIRGVTFDDPVSGMSRQAAIRAFVRPGIKLDLVPEPDNPVDSDAVAVYLRRRVLFTSKEYHLGYLTHELAKDMLRHIAKKENIKVTVLEVTGGKDQKASRGVNILISF